MKSELIEHAFLDCIGHKETTVRLTRLLLKGRIPHALLFSGPSGVGKLRIARALGGALLSGAMLSDATLSAKESLAQSPTDSLRLASLGNHPDLHLLQLEEGKKDISVEQIRSLISALGLKPYSAPCSVAVIDNAHRMSVAACNALLKTLEEPTGHTYLILVTDAAHRLPATIRSRCQALHFRRLENDEIRALISRLSETAIPPELLDSLTTLADGSLTPLEVEPFVDPRSLRILDIAAFGEHLNQIGSKMEELTRKFSALLTGRTKT